MLGGLWQKSPPTKVPLISPWQLSVPAVHLGITKEQFITNTAQRIARPGQLRASGVHLPSIAQSVTGLKQPDVSEVLLMPGGLERGSSSSTVLIRCVSKATARFIVTVQ